MNRFARIYRTERSAIELERILGIGAFDLKNILSVAPDLLDEEDHEHDETRGLGLHRHARAWSTARASTSGCSIWCRRAAPTCSA